MSRLKHYDRLGTVRFMTFSCYKRQNLLHTPESKTIVVHSIESVRRDYSLSILAYVVMPNHVHLVVLPEPGTLLGALVGHIKRRSSLKLTSSWKSLGDETLRSAVLPASRKESYALWQPRCYDHNCRTPETVREKIVYCHNNPVRANLVDSPTDWEWSSARWYAGDLSGRVRITDEELS